MDAAIDHFGQMGYRKADVCRVVNKLLKVYGKDGWSFLEERCYLVVQEALLEMQEQEEKLQLQVLPEQQLEQYEDDDGGRDEEEEDQLQEDEKLQLQVLQEQQLEQHDDDYGGDDYEEEAQLELLQAGVEEEDQPLELMQAEVEEDEPLQLEEAQQEEVEENNEAQEFMRQLQGPQHQEVEENDEAQVIQPEEAAMMDAPLANGMPIMMVEEIQLDLPQEELEENTEAPPEEAAMLEAPSENAFPIVMVLVDAEEETQLPGETAVLDAPSPLENVMPIVMVLVDDEEESQLYLQGPEQHEENEEARQQEAEMMEEPLEDFSPIAMVVPPSEEVVPMLVNPPSPRAVSLDLAATGTKRTRPFCYGWISDSESDSDYEEYHAR